jgi:tetratricopeptide (TPR) repeat protein
MAPSSVRSETPMIAEWLRPRRIVIASLGATIAVVAAIALAVGDHEAPAVAAQSYRTYAPKDPKQVVAQVPPRDPREVAMRRALREAPARVDLAVQLARIDIQRSRSLSDPRYLGRAQATLARWYDLPQPPPDVLLLRATIRQSLHDFPGARVDLDHLIAERPQDAQAQLTRAVVATITADYAAARESCARVAELADALIAATCIAPVDALTGHLTDATNRLTQAVAGAANEPPLLRTFAITALAELAIMRGDYATAETLFREVITIDPDDAYARAGLADVLMWTGKPTEASALLAGRESIDNLLVRRAIAEHLAAGPEAAKWTKAMRDRIAAAAERGDRIHMREEARFTLEVEGDAPRALSIALDDWAVQKELADARLVAATAMAASRPEAADPIRAWVRTNHIDDAQLRKLLP